VSEWGSSFALQNNERGRLTAVNVVHPSSQATFNAMAAAPRD